MPDAPRRSVKVDTVLDRPKPGDLYILCSDGLCGPVNDGEIRELAMSTPDLKTAATRMVERANEHGGPDNITVVLAKVVGVG